MKKILLIILLLILCSCTNDREDYNLTNFSNGEDDYTVGDDFMVVSRTDYCGWVAMNYDNVNSDREADYEYDVVEHQGTYYTFSGEIVEYEMGYSKIFVDEVSIYSSYDYSEEQLLNGKEHYTKVSPIVYKESFETDDILGTINEDGTYDIGFSPGYLGDNIWIKTTLNDDGEVSDYNVDIPAIGIGNGDEEDCADLTNKGLEMFAHCKYYAEDMKLEGEYYDEVSSYEGSGADYEQSFMGYKIRWSFTPKNVQGGGSLELNAQNDIEILNDDSLADFLIDEGC